MIDDILLTHFQAYPLMTAQDAVKLVYQHVFGPEHLITDGGKTLLALDRELDALPKGPENEPLYESIGNGLARLNLRPCAARGIPAEDINQLFVASAQAAVGDPKQFWQAIKALQKLADADETPFDPVELDLFLARYPKKPAAVHHSDAYRNAYHPAYRVVLQRKVKDYLAAKRKEK